MLRSSPLLRDVLLGVLLTLVAEVELLLSLDRAQGSVVGNQLAYLLILPAVGLRRRAPLVGIAFAALGFALEPVTGSAPVATPFLVLLFLLASFGWHAETRTGLVGLGLVLLGGLTYDLSRAELNVADLVVNVVIIVAAWASGRIVRMSSDRRVRAELAADRAARDAVAGERERIGRDLHDSMAHALTLITLQAGGARERTDPGVAADALAAIEQSGREALADMHRFLDLLGGTGSDDAPGVSHLPELVEGVRRGGLAVDLDVAAGELPPSVSTTVYRVVQEALTNVVRHSEARSARVEVSRDDHALVARVTDDGSPTASARVNGSGRGLAGLRERLSLFDGTLDTRRTEQGWSLEARIPLPRGLR